MIAFGFGIAFALIAQYARLNTFDAIVATALRRRHDVVQIMLVAVAVSSVAFFGEYLLGGAVVAVKPFYLIGVSVGGLLFGIGVAILGYCPGTMTMALAEGSLDAVFGIAGGVLAGAIYTVAYPAVRPFIGPDFGELNLYASNRAVSAIIVLAYAATLLTIALKILPARAAPRNAAGALKPAPPTSPRG